MDKSVYIYSEIKSKCNFCDKEQNGYMMYRKKIYCFLCFNNKMCTKKSKDVLNNITYKEGGFEEKIQNIPKLQLEKIKKKESEESESKLIERVQKRMKMRQRMYNTRAK
jgi:hypothetical protein